MKLIVAAAIAVTTLLMSFKQRFVSEDYPTLAINARAPDFKLMGVDGKTYTLASFSKAKILAIIFTCNHCPTAQAYEDRMIKLTNDYKAKGVQVIAISPNDPTSVRVDELGYTDMGDSYAEMKLRAKHKKYNFPYLYDGKTETASKAYGPVATPHIFIFDQERKLRYQGRIDDVEKPTKTPNNPDALNAINALLDGKEPPVQTTKVFGCSIKWASKSDWVKEYKEKWAKEPVDVEMIDGDGIKDLIKNGSDKLRLINVWSASSATSAAAFPDLVTINRMYRRRDFEFITINADGPAKKDNVLKFLKSNTASGKNYLFSANDKSKLTDAIGAKWNGSVPYTTLVEPGGNIVFSKQGAIDAAEMKKTIVDNKYVGRYY